MITEELFVHIDSNWRTIPDKDGRVIEGFSIGGMEASFYASRNPDLYYSTVIMAGPHVGELTSHWVENLRIFIKHNLSVSLFVGAEHGQLNSMRNLHKSINSLMNPHQFDIVPGVGHNVSQPDNCVVIQNLKFHANCFSISDPDFFYPCYVANKGKFYIPL